MKTIAVAKTNDLVRPTPYMIREAKSPSATVNSNRVVVRSRQRMCHASRLNNSGGTQYNSDQVMVISGWYKMYRCFIRLRGNAHKLLPTPSGCKVVKHIPKNPRRVDNRGNNLNLPSCGKGIMHDNGATSRQKRSREDFCVNIGQGGCDPPLQGGNRCQVECRGSDKGRVHPRDGRARKFRIARPNNGIRIIYTVSAVRWNGNRGGRLYLRQIRGTRRFRGLLRAAIVTIPLALGQGSRKGNPTSVGGCANQGERRYREIPYDQPPKNPSPGHQPGSKMSRYHLC